jgi:hypothetical protein
VRRQNFVDILPAHLGDSVEITKSKKGLKNLVCFVDISDIYGIH